MSRVVHFEFSVPDPEQTATFYRSVFGWAVQKLPEPARYWQIQTGNTPDQLSIPGGIVQSKSGSPRVSVTISVESLADACHKVTANGGRLITERQVFPGGGNNVS